MSEKPFPISIFRVMVSLLQLRLLMPCRRVGCYISFIVIIAHLICSGFNMGNDLARFLAYQAHLVNGNTVTGLLSIGGKSPMTGPDPPPPAIVGGLDTHGTFEGAIF
jgi:hypothetical protein